MRRTARRTRTAALAVAAGLVLVGACGTSEPDPAPLPTTETADPEPEPDPDPEAEAEDEGSGDPALVAVGDVTLDVSTVAEDLDAPWDVVGLADGRLLVSQRDERTLVVVDPGTGATETVTGSGADDLRDGTDAAGEGGLMGLALAPDDERTLFVYRTGADGNEVLRGELDGSALGDLEPVVTGIPRASNHNGGRIAFGPDGFLYVATGDAARTETSQDPGSLAGKILRVTRDGDPAPGNPDEGSPVWSLGHRNVQGLGWDVTSRMFASEFGQNTLDELNVIEPGGNYGWPDREGTAGGDQAGFVDPIATWSTADASPSGIAVTEEGVYMAGLRGQRLWRVPFAGEGSVPDDGSSPDAFGEPQAVLTDLGRLRAVVRDPADAASPSTDGASVLYVLTNNTDGRGSPRAGDDQLLRVTVTPED